MFRLLNGVWLLPSHVRKRLTRENEATPVSADWLLPIGRGFLSCARFMLLLVSLIC